MISIEDHEEFIKKHIPQYLTNSDKDSLTKEIESSFPYSDSAEKVYIQLTDLTHYYQGDTLVDIPFSNLNLSSGQFETMYLKACIMSNTCDIAPENGRLEEPNIIFGVVVSLEQYIEALKAKNINFDRISNFVFNLKSNRITNLFYLPALKIDSKIVFEESFVRFDFTVSIPISLFKMGGKYKSDYINNEGDRIFTLSNYGFYLYILKLSVHFCRFREGVFRNKP